MENISNSRTGMRDYVRPSCSSTRKFVKPSKKTLQNVMKSLKKAGGEGLRFTELVKEVGLSKDAVARSLRYLGAQGLVRKKNGKWIFNPEALTYADEAEVWLEMLGSLDDELYKVMLKRLSEMKGEIKTEECIKLAEKVATKLEEWKDDYERLEEALTAVELLPEESLKRLTPLLKSTAEEYLRKCPRRYIVQDAKIFKVEFYNEPSQLAKFLGPRLDEKGDPISHPNVFSKALELLCRVLKGEEKFRALLQLLREALNANVNIEKQDVRAYILTHVEDKKRMHKSLIEMFQQEKNLASKEAIKDILERFDKSI